MGCVAAVNFKTYKEYIVIATPSLEENVQRLIMTRSWQVPSSGLMHTGETAVSGIGKIASTMCADVRGDETGFDERDENPDAAPAK